MTVRAVKATGEVGRYFRIGALPLALAPLLVLVSHSALAERVWDYTYTDNGQLEIIDGPRTDVNDTTTFTYDSTNNLIAREDALGHTTQFANYTALGLPQQITDPNGVITTLTYDWRGHVTSRAIQTGSGTVNWIYTYNPIGQLTRVNLPDGSVLSYTYDPARRLTSIEDSAGNRIEFEHDAMSNVTAEMIKNDSGVITKRHQQVFDELGRLMTSIDADSIATRYGYDKNSNLTSVIDGDSRETRHAYDALNRLSQITDPIGGQVTFTYDDADNLTSVTDQRGLETRYDYNFAGEVIAQHSPDTGTTTFERDNAGNVIRKTDARGVVTEYQYDALNRLIQATFPASPEESITYTYDETTDGNKGIGRLTGIIDQSGRLSYRYDGRGNLIESTQVIESQSYTTLYRYDLADNLIGMTYPSGRIVTYQRDAVGQVNAVLTQESAGAEEQVVVDAVSYLPFGPMKRLSFGNGLVRDVTYNQDYQVTSIASGAMERSYSYDLANNIQSITDLLDPSKTQTFQYDALSRLTQATGAYGSISYNYDGVGNRTGRSLTQNDNFIDESYAYASDSNRLTQIQIDDNGAFRERNLSYTPVGNISEDQAPEHQLDLIYNQQNRLEEVHKDGSPLSMYIHNALGQRVVKIAINPEANVHFHYDQSGQLMAESTPDGVVQRETIYLNGVPVAVVAQDEPVVEEPGVPSEDIIVDNMSADATASGTWPLSTYNKRFYETNYAYHPPGTGENSFVWNPPVSMAGAYRVYAYWTSDSNRASDAIYSIQTVDGKVPVSVNQRTGGGSWVALGDFNLGESASISLTDDADGYVIADAIKLVWLGEQLPAVIITDNDAPNTWTEGTWPLSTSSGGYQGADYQFHAKGQGDNVFAWQPALSESGSYRVYARWTSASNRATDANYVIHTVNEPVSVKVNQQASGGTWQLLGTYDLGSGFKVELSDLANGYVIADAIKVERAY